MLITGKTSELDDLALRFAHLCSQAGREIMAVYGRGAVARTKADLSPVTEADERAEEILLAGLAELLPGVTVVAEEAVAAHGLPTVGAEFVLVDPLDGTKEFLTGSGEFTVNIGLVQDGRPTAGCVYAPALGSVFTGGQRAHTARLTPGDGLDPAVLQEIRTRSYPSAGLVAVTSRSHLDPTTQAFLDRLRPTSTTDAGSSLKLCLVAQGLADVYPRFAPTMEWDIAAGDAVLRAAGGTVVDEQGVTFGYGKTRDGLRNTAFVAWGQQPLEL